MEPHERADVPGGSALGAGSEAGASTLPVRQPAPNDGAAVTTHVDPAFRATPGADRLAPVEAYLLEALERLDTAETKAIQLEAALEHSREIGAAIGVLMALRKLTQEQAFDLLRRASMAQNVKLHVLAVRVVETGSTESG